MNRQLTLITTDEPADWRLDQRTRDLGRKGLAEARAALAAAAATSRRPAA